MLFVEIERCRERIVFGNMRKKERKIRSWYVLAFSSYLEEEIE